MTDALAAECGLDIEHDPWTHALWKAAHQSFALERWVSENKFGPHRVVCRTPLANIRITTSRVTSVGWPRQCGAGP